MGPSIHSSEYRQLLVLIRRLRTEAGMSQKDLAERLSRPQSWISKVEVGERRIDIEELRQLCNALDIGLVDVVKRWLGSTGSES